MNRKTGTTKQLFTALGILALSVAANLSAFAQTEPAAKQPYTQDRLNRQVALYKKYHAYKLKVDSVNKKLYIEVTLMHSGQPCVGLGVMYNFTYGAAQRDITVPIKNGLNIFKVYLTAKDMETAGPDADKIKIVDFAITKLMYSSGGTLMDYTQFYPAQ